MKRDEFEAVLKRALELQGHQTLRDDDSMTEEDLANAAQRLNISPEVMHRAFTEIRRSRKQFRVKGTPNEVREAFLKTFLLQHVQLPNRIPPLKIDRQALQIGRSTTVRVQDPQFPEIDAEVSFTADGPDHTIVSWTGNTTLSLRTNVFASAIPILIAGIMTGPLLMSGAPFLAILSSMIVPLMLLGLMHSSFRRNAKRVNTVLTEYFENIQILGDLQEQKSTEQELLELRAWKEKMTVQPAADATQPASQMASPAISPPPLLSREEDVTTETPPPPPQMNKES